MCQSQAPSKKNALFNAYVFLSLLLTGYLMFLPSKIGTLVSALNKVLMIAFFFVYVPKNRGIKKSLLVLTLLVYWLVDYLRVSRTTIFSLIPIIILVFYCSSGAVVQRTTYSLFRKAFIFVSLCGIVAYIVFFTGLLPPLSIEDFYEEGTGNSYYNYGLSIILVNQSGFAFRLCGLFNEPGMMGTIAALFLIAERFDFSKIGNWIILIAGVFAFSLAFWVIVVISRFFDALMNRRKSSIIIVACVFLGYGALLSLSTNNSNINRLVSRISIEDGGKLAGDQRTSYEFDNFYEGVKKSPVKLLFGAKIDEDLIPSSYKKFIVQYGLLLTLLIFVPLFVSLMKMCSGNKDAQILTICFFLSIYQRPIVFNMLYFVILVGGIQSILYSSTLLDHPFHTRLVQRITE